jgi:5-methyltetrahydrofolate corrinoid/iron sulfur protein methyltransferase
LLLAADNLHGLNQQVSDALKRLDPEPIRKIVGRCISGGADYIDINPGYLSAKNIDRMEFLVETVQKCTALPLILDSPSSKVIERGLSVCRNKPVVNGVSLEKSKLTEILPLAAQWNADLVVFLMDERAFVPAELEAKIAIALELKEAGERVGLGLDKLIFDPVLPSLSWEEPLFRIGETVRTVRLLGSGALLQDAARTMVGLSNLRSQNSFPFSVELTCLNLLAGAGLSIVLANALNSKLIDAFLEINSILKNPSDC